MTRRDAASIVARYKNHTPLSTTTPTSTFTSTSTSTSTIFKTRPPLSTYFLHLFSFPLALTLALSSHAAERHWVGTTSASANVAANWAENAVPADGDTVILDADSADKPMTWNLSVSPGGWSQTNYAGTVTFDRGTNAVVMSGDVDLASGKWTHTANPSFSSSSYEWTSGRGSKHLVVSTSGSFTLQGGASIDVTGKGFCIYQGPGRAISGTGGSHGGTSAICDANKNVPRGYGSARCPETIGSCGSDNWNWSSTGGGAVYISTAKRLLLDGTVAADGNPVNGGNPGSKPDYYAGTGGSVWLVAGSLAGTGSVHAAGTSVGAYSAGGGGRVAVHLTGTGEDFSSFTGTLSAPRGSGASGKAPAFCGTVYRETKTDAGVGELIIDGASASIANLDGPQMGNYGTYVGDESTQTYSRITLRWPAQLVIPSNVTVRVAEIVSENDSTYKNRIILRGGGFELPKDTSISGYRLGVYAAGSRLGFWQNESTGVASVVGKTVIASGGILDVSAPFSTVSDLEVLDGGRVTHCAGTGYKWGRFALNLFVPGDICVREGGMIHANGCGCSRGGGTGVSSASFSGASHGGIGWSSTDSTGRVGNGKVYGSVRYPNTYGSGGGWTSTEGGGIVRVTATGTVLNDGTISANAAKAEHHTGSGGSVWLTAGHITGSGTVSANGGDLWNNSGSGGGGHVAVYLSVAKATFSDYAGKIIAYGGCQSDKFVKGGPGTVYLETADQGTANGTLIIDNGPQAYTGWEAGSVAAVVGGSVTDAEVGDVRIVGQRSRLRVADGYTLSFSGTWTNASYFVADSNSTVVARDATRPGFVYGTNTFCNFNCSTPGKILSFGCLGSLLSVSKGGVLTFAGDEDTALALYPSDPGATWRVCVCEDASSDVSHVVVSNSDATAGMIIVAKSSTGNMDGESSGWRFQNVVRGAVITWTGSFNDAWSNPSNWDIGREPTETDNIVIAATGTQPVASKAIAAWSLTVESGASLSLAGNDVAVSNLTVSGTLTAGGAETIAVTKDATFTGGTFECARSTLLFEGEDNQAFAPAGIKFNNVRIEKDGGTLSVGGGFSAERFYTAVSAPVTIAFQRGSLVTARQVAFDGLVDNAACLTLESSASGASWKIVATACARANGVIVSDSDATGGLAFRTAAPSTVTRSANWSVLPSTFTWTGTSDNNFTNAANWAGGVAPGADDSVSIEGPATLALKTPWTVRDLTLGGGEGAVTFAGSAALTVSETFEIATNATVTLNVASSVGGSLVIRNGGKLTHSANGSTVVYRLDLSVGGDVIIESGGCINVQGRGYAKGKGPGHGVGSCGASHGGLANGNAQATVAPAYGYVFCPVTFGSGGSDNWSFGTSGGGAVEIAAGGDVLIDGEINADANDDLVCPAGAVEYGYYTGSGGSVWLRSKTLSGIGTIHADGGDIAFYHQGSGGRIAVWLSGAATPADSLAITVYGGRRIAPPAVYYPAAGAGTVYVQGASQTERHGTIRIDNDGGSGMTPFPVDDAGTAPYRSATFVVTAGGSLSLTNDLTIGDLELSSSGKVYLNGHTLSVVSRAHRRELKASEAAGRIVKGGGALVFARRGLIILAK